MKQHITREQYAELTTDQLLIFSGWTLKEINETEENGGSICWDGDERSFDIGSMIEFLGVEFLTEPANSGGRESDVYNIVWNKNNELCDELWEKVKDRIDFLMGKEITTAVI